MKRIVPILILIVFTSCDPGVVNKYVVENQTDSVLRIESKLNFVHRSVNKKDSVDKVELKPEAATIITEYGEIGRAHDKGEGFLSGIDTIIVKMNNRTLIKDIYDRKNWEYKVLKSGTFLTDEVEYLLKLSKTDFE